MVVRQLPQERRNGRSSALEEARGAERGPRLSTLDRAVLLTVLYADLFDFSLTRAELYRRLIGAQSTVQTVEEAIERLEGSYLTVASELIVLKGRERLIPLRRHRSAVCHHLRPIAYRYAAWLRLAPFVRMVAVSGSLAVENADRGSDVDLFCITDTNRLWLARLFIVPISKMTRLLPSLFPAYLCPNYILAADALEIQHRNLFTAHEVTQAVPLWGADMHRKFAAANAWTVDFLAHAGPASAAKLPDRRPLVAGWIERIFKGRFGDVVDAGVHLAFVSFYWLRASSKGWKWASLRHTYQRSRYTVPEGGYVDVVRRLLVERAEACLGGGTLQHEIENLFPGLDTKPSCYDWESIFRRDYGRSERPSPTVSPPVHRGHVTYSPRRSPLAP